MDWLHDRRFRLALELSLLLHLLLAWLLPQATALGAILLPRAAAPQIAPPPADEEPIRFELVELPDQVEEEPSRSRTPLSDLSRRAHGGEGAPSDRPEVRGVSPDLRLAPPSPRRVPQPEQAQGSPEESRRAAAETRARTDPTGSGDVLVRPQEAEKPEAPILKGLATLKTQGGQVDLGALSFDTQWYDWGPYAAEMLRRIRYHWRIPEIAMLGVPGVTRIHFFIEKTGAVSGVEIVMDAEHPPMTFSARDAIIDSSPLPPLPADLHSEREGVTITFYYNTRPPEEGGGR